MTESAAAAPSDKRTRLLEAALALFEQRGYDGVAVPEISRAAGVAVGTVYRYFATKEALANALFRHWKGAYNRFVLEPPDEGTTPRDVFIGRWRRMTLFARANPRAMRFLCLHHHAPYLDAESRALEEADRAAMERLQSPGSLAPVLAAALAWGALAGLMKFSEEGRVTLDLTASAELGEAVWRALSV